MASLPRRTAAALLDVTARKSISTPFSHSAISSAATLSVDTSNSPNVPQIFDIFDAPVMLRDWNSHGGSSGTVNPTQISSERGRLRSRNVYGDVIGLPRSLPPPVIFDGPARPLHMLPSTLQKRRLERQSPSRLPKEVCCASTVTSSALPSTSVPSYQVFDGPSRITRHRYPSSRDKGYSVTYVSLALCVSSAFGWLVFKDILDQNDIPSLAPMDRKLSPPIMRATLSKMDWS